MESTSSIGGTLACFANALNQNGSSLNEFIEKNYLKKWVSDDLYRVMRIRTTFIAAMTRFLTDEGLLNLERVSLSPVTDPLAHDIEHSPTIRYKGQPYKTTHSMIYSKFLACFNPKIKGIFVDSPNIRLEIEDPNGVQRGKYLIDFSQMDIELRRSCRPTLEEYFCQRAKVEEILRGETETALSFFERLIAAAVGEIVGKNADDLKALKVSLAVPETPFPRITRDEAVRLTGTKAFEAPLGDVFKTHFFWITGLMRENYDLIYPYLNKDGSKIPLSDFRSEQIYNYDLCARSRSDEGVWGQPYEVLSGALREWLYEPIVERLIDNKILRTRPQFSREGELLNPEDLDGYGPFLCAAHALTEDGERYFPATYGGGLGVERFLFSVLKGAVVKTVDDVTFFGKNPDSHPIYLF